MRRLAWFALPFSAALLLSCCAPVWWLVFPAAALCSAGLPLVRRLDRPIRIRSTLALLGALTGFLWCGLYTAVIALPMNGYAGEEQVVTAEVTEYPAESDFGCSAVVRVTSGDLTGRRILAYLEGDYADLKPGDTVTGTARFSLPNRQDGYAVKFSTPHSVFLQAGFTVTSSHICHTVPLKYFPARLGHEIQRAIARLYSGQERGVLTALLTGERSGVDDPLYHSFSRSGTAHLLAVSGLHVSFLTGLIFLIPGGRRRGLIALPVLLCFALMTGGAAPVWRAALMSALLLLAPLVRREADPVTSLSLALFLMLLVNPYAVRSPGLQLSFSAVAGLVLIQPRLYVWLLSPLGRHPGLWRGRTRPLARIYQLFCASIATSCSSAALTLPLTALYFGQISLAGPLTNLAAIWITSLCFALGFFSCLLWWAVPPLGVLLARPTALLLRLLIRIAQTVGRWQFAAIPADNAYLRVWLGFFLFVVALALMVPAVRKNPLLPMAATLVLFVLALGLRALSFSTAPLAVTALDVGQGSCTVLLSEGTAVAVDCGGYDAGDALADHLLSCGIHALDTLVLTHYDADHVDGLEALLDRMEVKNLILPDITDGSGLRIQLMQTANRAGISIIWTSAQRVVLFGSAEMTIFPPLGDKSDNARSLSTLVRWGGHSVLITGDLPIEQESVLLDWADLPRLDILVAGHHGSASSSGDELLTACRPGIALISVGAANHYGLPSADALRRLDHYRAHIYRTDENGSVTVRFH